MKIFAQRLKEAREKQNLTQEEFAKELGMSWNTYRNYETVGTGHTTPKQETLVKIAELLNTTTDFLLGR